MAHEINTSVQFISDSVRFVRHALKDVPRALADYRALAAGVLSGREVAQQARLAGETDEAADVDYFLENAPEALDRALEGISRVGSIVRSMTEFAHPDSRTKSDVDINRAIMSTLNMARNEYKAVAELETDLGEIPPVHCHAGDVNQVVLNLLLNAAHAIGDAVEGTSRKGRITRGHAADRRLRRDLHRRHRRGHPRVGEGAHLRTVRHDQGSRARYRPGPGAVARHRGRKAQGFASFRNRNGKRDEVFHPASRVGNGRIGRIN